MIKQINHQNLLTTPFVAAKAWNLSNAQNEDVIVLEQSPSTGVALDYIDYSSGTPVLSDACSIAIEQQHADLVSYEEGITGSGKFNPNAEPQNSNGTYKRLVYNQIKRAFYNSYNNPLEIFGTEHIDFPLSRTNRNFADEFRMFTIPQNIFGDKIVPSSIKFYDTNLDDNIEIFDDGYQNLIAGKNLFSKIQEVRHISNLINSGSVETCSDYFTHFYLTIVTDTLFNACYNQFYSDFIIVTNGVAPYTWSLDSGMLPPGLSLNTSTGEISGISTTSVPTLYSFTIKVSDSIYNFANKSYTIFANYCGIIILTDTLPNACYSQSYSNFINVVGGTPPYTWSLDSGTFPPGLSLNTSTGEISGTSSLLSPLDITYPLTISVSGVVGTPASHPYTITATFCGIWENFEAYSIGSDVNDLNGPYGFNGSWITGSNFINYHTSPLLITSESFEAYTVGNEVDGLNGPYGWGTPWAEYFGPGTMQVSESFEAYTVGNNLNGSNGPAGWTGGWAVN